MNLAQTGDPGVSIYAVPVPVTTIADLLALLTREPGRPRITWYGDGGERVELSGAVLENWVNKTANLLVEEFDAGPGTRVLLDLPPHWRTVVWALATWRVGACVVIADGGSVDVVVTDRPELHPHAGHDLVAVTLPALARRFDGVLPVGAVDAASAVMTYGDALGWVPPSDLTAPALVGAGPDLPHAVLVGVAAPKERRVVRVEQSETRSLRGVLELVVGALHGDGSIVLVDDRAASWTPDRLRRLAETERASAVDTIAD